MKKSDAVIFLVFCVIIASLVFAGKLVDSKRQGDVQAQDKNINAKVAALNASSAAEELRVSKLNCYQKLKEGKPISVLVIGDEFGESTGASQGGGWSDTLISKLSNTYGSTVTVTKMTLAYTNITRGWAEYNKERSASKYDCIFICYGQNDQSQLQIKNFHMLYEDLVRKITADNPHVALFPIIENSLAPNAGESIDITAIASHYGLDLINTSAAFAQSGKSAKDLTLDGTHPNNAGYALYSDAILKTISANVKSGKSLVHATYPVFYNDSSNVNYNFISKCSSATGFKQKNGVYTSNNAGDQITFTADTGMLLLYCNVDSTTGKMKVNIDGVITEINTRSYTQATDTYLILCDDKAAKHTIKCTTETGPVNISGIVTS